MKILRLLALCTMLLPGCGTEDSEAPENLVDAGTPGNDGGNAAEDTGAGADARTSEDTGEGTDMGPAPDAPDMGDAVPGYDDLSQWLCHPERDDDPCDENLDITRVLPDGTTEVIQRAPAADPAFDCFYVYPTTSLDAGPNSDRLPGPEERFVVQNQAAQLSTVCRLFAPMYRQITVNGLFSGDPDADGDLAYGDVADAFAHYMAQENNGRGVVLIGHSQGTRMLNLLVQNVFDEDSAMREQLIAAYLIGFTVAVPEGADVGGTFANVPLCREPSQTGCVVTYASYRAADPPGPGALFGKAGAGQMAGCTNPAALASGTTTLSPIFPATVPSGLETFIGNQTTPWDNPSDHPPIATGYCELPGIAEGTCTVRGEASYFEIGVLGDPGDPRVNNLGGDLAAGWGLHLIDMNLTQRDIIDLMRAQAEAYEAR